MNPIVPTILNSQSSFITAYATWKSNQHNEPSSFELVLNKCPFGGEFALFAGLDEILKCLSYFTFSSEDCDLLQKHFPSLKSDFFSYLQGLDLSNLKVFSVKEGTIIFPRIPMVIIEGPLLICQLLENLILLSTGFPTLVTTYAARHRLCCPNQDLVEVGISRAHSAESSLLAAKYSYLGGFNGTSNVAASLKFNIPACGNHSNAYIHNFNSIADLSTTKIVDSTGHEVEFVEDVMKYLTLLKKPHTNQGELAAFISLAQTFSTSFSVVLDTYDALNSGLWNFLAVSLALYQCGFKPVGVRIDQGDLAYLSRKIRVAFHDATEKYQVSLSDMQIMVSNEICPQVLLSLSHQKHDIDVFGIGSHIATSKADPILHSSYKCVSVSGKPSVKLSEDPSRITLPFRKHVYRLFNTYDTALVDVMFDEVEEAPVKNTSIVCRHPFAASKRAHVTPSRVDALHHLVFDGKVVPNYGLTGKSSDWTPDTPYEPLHVIRERIQTDLSLFREDHLRLDNPTPYKISLSSCLFDKTQDILLDFSPIQNLE